MFGLSSSYRVCCSAGQTLEGKKDTRANKPRHSRRHQSISISFGDTSHRQHQLNVITRHCHRAKHSPALASKQSSSNYLVVKSHIHHTDKQHLNPYIRPTRRSIQRLRQLGLYSCFQLEKVERLLFYRGIGPVVPLECCLVCKWTTGECVGYNDGAKER